MIGFTVFGRTDVVELCARPLVLCNLSSGFSLCETTRYRCVKNSYVVRPPVPQEVEPCNMAGTFSCADPTARFPCIYYDYDYLLWLCYCYIIITIIITCSATCQCSVGRGHKMTGEGMLPRDQKWDRRPLSVLRWVLPVLRWVHPVLRRVHPVLRWVHPVLREVPFGHQRVQFCLTEPNFSANANANAKAATFVEAICWAKAAKDATAYVNARRPSASQQRGNPRLSLGFRV
jgi:hypothetical protein